MLIPLLLLPFFLTGIFFIALYWSFNKKKYYWEEKNIPCKAPRFLTGNFAEAGTKNLGVIFRELYEEGKLTGQRAFGVWQFTVPILLLLDPDLIKKILLADFSHFDDHGVYFNEETDPLSANLLTLGGAAWRNLRGKLNPAFTGGKLKMMFPLMMRCGEELRKVLENPAESQQVVEFKDLFARFTTDVIASCAFGIETNSLTEEDSIFRSMGKKVFQSSWEVLWRNFVGFLFPNFSRLFKIRIYPKDLTNFFIGITRETMDYRERNNIKRNDILQMLIQLKNEGFIRDSKTPHKELKAERFTYEQAAAQAFIFFTAGFETSSTTMQYALYELAMNPDIQNRVRDEIQEVISKTGKRFTYEAVQEMNFLGRILDETLRKYPPATNLSRVCTKDYKIPGTETVLEKGTQVSVSVYGLHMDERYYPQPERFDPERFTEEQKALRPPYTYMPFGEGPRSCIGQRFGLTQAKVGLISILSNYEISISKDTRVPPVYDPKSFFFAPQGGMHLKISFLGRKKNGVCHSSMKVQRE